MDVLMHICCANCSVYPLGLLRAEGLNLKGYWYNPNIQPEGEYSLRLDAVRALAAVSQIEMTYDEPSQSDRAILDGTPATRPERCHACYSVRLMRTASEARRQGMDAFTTSLLVSPYQAHELIVQAGQAASAEHKIEFLYRDFRPGWRQGQTMAREQGFYRQYYCGCLRSKAERDREIHDRKARPAKAMAAAK